MSRTDYIGAKTEIQSLYFGGGTPSILSKAELGTLIEIVHKHYNCASEIEVCVEANPDDLSLTYLNELKSLNVNRLSIGVQSFDQELLQWMNRSHNAEQASRCIQEAANLGFDQLSIDLIYGIPGLSAERWQQELEKVLSLPIQHLSAYSLTLEPKTAYAHQVKKGESKAPSDQSAEAHYRLLIEQIEVAGWEQYEVSNFCRDGLYSTHNTAYWQGVPYLGIGPSAHSFNGEERSWNVSSNAAYIDRISKGESFAEKEVLSSADKVNEYLLTSLRTKWGLDLKHLNEELNYQWNREQAELISSYMDRAWMLKESGGLKLSQEGLLFADHISASLFIDHSSHMSS